MLSGEATNINSIVFAMILREREREREREFVIRKTQYCGNHMDITPLLL
jgi:hypothetical protein